MEEPAKTGEPLTPTQPHAPTPDPSQPLTTTIGGSGLSGRIEHLRGSALGFRNLTNNVARCLLEAGGFRPCYTLGCDEPDNLEVQAPGCEQRPQVVGPVQGVDVGSCRGQAPEVGRRLL